MLKSKDIHIKIINFWQLICQFQNSTKLSPIVSPLLVPRIEYINNLEFVKRAVILSEKLCLS